MEIEKGSDGMLIDCEGSESPSNACHPARAARPCLLCDLALNRQHEELSSVIQGFVADHITRTQVSKIAQDVLQVLQENLTPEAVEDTTHNDIVVHIQTHTTNPAIIMTQMVRDLSDLANAARDTCILVCPETQQKIVNSKAASVYLKTVSELQTALRHEALRLQK